MQTILDGGVEQQEAAKLPESNVQDVVRLLLRCLLVLIPDRHERCHVLAAGEYLHEVRHDRLDRVRDVRRRRLGAVRQRGNVVHLALGILKRGAALAFQLGPVFEADRLLLLGIQNAQDFIVGELCAVLLIIVRIVFNTAFSHVLGIVFVHQVGLGITHHSRSFRAGFH